MPFAQHMLTFIVALCLEGIELVNVDTVAVPEWVMFKPVLMHTLRKGSFCVSVVHRTLIVWLAHVLG